MHTLLLTLALAGPIPTPPPSGDFAMAPSLHATDTGAWLTWLDVADDGTAVSEPSWSHWGFTATGHGKAIRFTDSGCQFTMGGQLGGFSIDELEPIN